MMSFLRLRSFFPAEKVSFPGCPRVSGLSGEKADPPKGWQSQPVGRFGTRLRLGEQPCECLVVAPGDSIAIAMAAAFHEPHAVSRDRDDSRVVGGEQPVIEDRVVTMIGGVEGDDGVVRRAYRLRAA